MKSIFRTEILRNNILVISDEDTSQNRETASALAREGFRVTNFSDNPEALLKTDELEPDVIIIDRPSAADGFAVCSQLRQTIDVPIIIVDNATGATAWPEAVKSGADLYLASPFIIKN